MFSVPLHIFFRDALTVSPARAGRRLFSGCFLCVLVLAACASSWAQPNASLAAFDVDITQTSVSGLSAGGFMAVQFSVAHSSIIKGAGIIAGGPYYCAQGDPLIAATRCSCTGVALLSPCEVSRGSTDVSRLISVTNRSAREKAIDPVSNLAGERIWLFSGAQDSVVPPSVMDDLRDYYAHYVADDNIRFRQDPRAGHAMPTDGFGSPCGTSEAPYLSNCGIDAAGDLLKWIYGEELNARNAAQSLGAMTAFDQREFADGRPEDIGLADAGFIYVPDDCRKQGGRRCRLHVAFHGCGQNVDMVGDAFIRHAGYNAWAETNRIIVMYPQASATFWRNSKACWDWFNFSGRDPAYATRAGRQIAAVRAMVDRIAGLGNAPGFMASCVTASNEEHVAAGRAHAFMFLAIASGSNRFIGLDNRMNITTLKETAPHYFEPGTCP